MTRAISARRRAAGRIGWVAAWVALGGILGHAIRAGWAWARSSHELHSAAAWLMAAASMVLSGLTWHDFAATLAACGTCMMGASHLVTALKTKPGRREAQPTGTESGR